MNWGSVTFDQGRNVMVVADMRMPVVGKLIPREVSARKTPAFRATHGALSSQFGLPYAHHLVNFMSPLAFLASNRHGAPFRAWTWSAAKQFGNNPPALAAM